MTCGDFVNNNNNNNNLLLHQLQPEADVIQSVALKMFICSEKHPVSRVKYGYTKKVVIDR